MDQLKDKKVKLQQKVGDRIVEKENLDAHEEYSDNLKRESWLKELMNCLKS